LSQLVYTMKLSAFTLIATLGLAASQVAARPVTLYILSPEKAGKANNVPAMAHMRWGLAAANAEVPTPEAKVGISMINPTEEFWNRNGKSPARTYKCSMRAKAITMANWVREKVGLPLIQMPEVGRIHGVVKPGFVTILESPHQPHQMPEVNASAVQAGHRVHFHEGKWAHEHHHHGWRATSFSGRLNKALMTLGPWEGRAVAFVLGCGIGSLLRMLYVLIVVTYRSIRPREEVLEASEIDILFEELEEVPPPPVYTDEKVALAEDK